MQRNDPNEEYEKDDAKNHRAVILDTEWGDQGEIL